MKISRFLAAVLASLLLGGFGGQLAAQAPTKPDILEIVDLKTIINEHSAKAVADQVERINETPKVKAVLLVIDTPGGGASASAVIYQELAKIKVPVVAYCEYICASGGVYAAMAPSVKFIGVRDDTIGGSVGVIMHLTRFNRLLDWAKVDNETYKSGMFKDAGNPTRAGQDEERKYLQSIVDSLAGKFYGVVTKARPKLSEAQLAELKSAKIFIGSDIVRVGLADKVMSRDEALAKAKELSGSKVIFTREELKKMSKAADEPHSTRPIPILPAQAAQDELVENLNYLMDTFKEVRQGESVRFEYRMPYRF